MILADTSVWIDHFRAKNPALSTILNANQALVHPLIIGELACGQVPNRRITLANLSKLPAAVVVSDQEALAFIERRNLAGKGIGYVDVHLLASAIVTPGALLWSNDRRLSSLAVALGVAYPEPHS